MSNRVYRLHELAELSGSELIGPADITIDRVATLAAAGPGAISFLANSRYRSQLAETKASAVILADAEACPDGGFARLHNRNPYLAFARIAQALNPLPEPKSGIDASASVADTAELGADVEVGPQAVIGAGAVVGARCIIGAGSVIGEGVRLGADARIGPNVTIIAAATLGDRVQIHPGVVIGSDGFGFAQADDHWEAVPQLGSVIIGDDVSIGSNTTIDRGAQGDTCIEAGCKIDNLVQVAHNVQIGAHTVIAAGTGISGSTRIGQYCAIGGQVGFAGHLAIADHATFTGMSMVTGNIREAGVYSSGVPAAPNKEWRRNAVRFRQLEDMARRLEKLERRLNQTGEKNDQSEH